jgi:hypothetical protein
MRHYNLSVIVATLLLISSCDSDPISVSTDLATPSFAGGSGVPCDGSGVGGLVFQGMKKWWGCFGVATIGGNANRQTAIETAADEWNKAFAHPHFTGIPRLAWTSGTPNVQVVEVGSGSTWCGGVNEPPSTVTMKADTVGSTNCPTNAAAFGTTLVHEFAHVLGFTQQFEKNVAVTGVSDKCAIHLPISGTINGTVCQHELELVLESYGQSTIPSIPNDLGNFWNRHIVTGLKITGLTKTDTLILQTGAEKTLTATDLLFTRGQRGPLGLTNENVTWSSDNPNKATVTPTGTVAGVEAGSTTLHAYVTPTGTVAGVEAGSTTLHAYVSGVSSQYQVGTLMKAVGQEIEVVVEAGGGGGPFKATGVSINTAVPITLVGTFSLTATVVNQPTGVLQVRWSITYSNGVLGPFNTSWGPNSYSLEVPEGSYNIRVTATPRIAGGDIGIPVIQDFPVCNEGGGGGGGGPPLLQSGLPDPGTEAVGGC